MSNNEWPPGTLRHGEPGRAGLSGFASPLRTLEGPRTKFSLTARQPTGRVNRSKVLWRRNHTNAPRNQPRWRELRSRDKRPRFQVADEEGLAKSVVYTTILYYNYVVYPPSGVCSVRSVLAVSLTGDKKHISFPKIYHDPTSPAWLPLRQADRRPRRRRAIKVADLPTPPTLAGSWVLVLQKLAPIKNS